MHPREIVSSYANLLGSINENNDSEPLSIIPNALPESLLPFESKTIRHALAIYLLHQNYNQQREIIEEAYLYLDNFIPDEEYKLFLALQSSKEGLESSSPVETIDRMNRLRMRTQSINIKKEESIEELNALRRIMNLPDNLSSFDGDQLAADQEKVQELQFNI
ncbi:MAG: hypothetical protein AAF462_03780 [Thermodesulfobacteriota bacterium]